MVTALFLPMALLLAPVAVDTVVAVLEEEETDSDVFTTRMAHAIA